MRETIMDLNGHPTRVMQSGAEGPALLLLHGFPEYSGAWEEVMTALPDCRCFAPDQRGYGISYRPDSVEDYAAGRLAKDMLDLIGALGLEQVHLLGHDWGASVAYAVAFAGDPRVVSLTILNGVHPIPFQTALAAGGAQTDASQYIPWLKREGSEDILAADDFARLLALFAEGMNMSWLTGARLARYKAAWQDAATLRAMVNWYRASPIAVPQAGTRLPDDQHPHLPAERMRVNIPHLLIWGLGDTALLPEARAGLEMFCADLTVQEIEGADHWLHHQKPDAVADLIRAFTRRHHKGA